MGIITKNKYRSNEDTTPTMPTSEISQDFEFISNNANFTGIRITTDTLYYVNGNSEIEVFNTSTKWIGSEDYMTINLLNDQNVSETFLNFFFTLYSEIQNYYYTLKVKINDKTYIIDDSNYTLYIKINGTKYKVE